jgi:hypothetical protein
MPESDVPGRRAAKLAERMARLLRDKEITDIAVALALLTSGVVEYHVRDFVEAQELLEASAPSKTGFSPRRWTLRCRCCSELCATRGAAVRPLKPRRNCCE